MKPSPFFTPARVGAAALLVLAAGFLQAAGGFQEPGQEWQPDQVLEADFHHLGDDVLGPDHKWKEAPREPEGSRLDIEFESHANESRGKK